MLLQASQSEFNVTTIAIWIVAMIAATALLALVIVGAKRWMFRKEEPAGTMWTLHDLVTLRDSGELTIEQYERLRVKIIRQVEDVGPAAMNGQDDVSGSSKDAPEGDSGNRRARAGL